MKLDKKKCKYVFVDVIRQMLHHFVMIYHSFKGLDFMRKDSSIHSKINNGYGVTDWFQINGILKYIEGNNLAPYMHSFLDIGCGKGYVLARLSKSGYINLAGIESIPRLFNIAIENYNKLKICHKITLYLEDAQHFECYDKYDTLFMYNPFPKEIMRSVINKIIASKQNQKYMIIYVHPQHHNEIISTGHFKLIGNISTKLQMQNINFYLSL